MEAVPLDDRGLLLGDGLFETLLWRDGRLMLAEAHVARMAEGAAVLGLPAPDPAAFLATAEAAVREAGLAGARAAVRVTLTAGSGGRGLDRPPGLAPRLFATAAASAPPQGPARLHVARVRRNQASPASRLKTLAYLDNVLARREALAAGADEALMLNGRGEVACAAAANVFWIAGGVLFTPGADTGRLGGIIAREVTRAAAALGVELREGAFAVGAVMDAEAVFLTSSLVGVRPAGFGPGPAPLHPLTARLADAVSAYA